jgi:guanine nucleotide-binding protein alpha-1 subunit
MRLLPLRHIEALLIAKLVPPNEEEATHLLGGGWGSGGSGTGTSIRSSTMTMMSSHSSRSPPPEVFVRPGTSWKGKVAISSSPSSAASPSSSKRPISGLELDKDEAQEVLNACWKDILALWMDPGVREVLRRRKVRLEEYPGL